MKSAFTRKLAYLILITALAFTLTGCNQVYRLVSTISEDPSTYNLSTEKFVTDPSNLKCIQGQSWTDDETPNFIIHYKGNNQGLKAYKDILELALTTLKGMNLPEFTIPTTKPSIYIDTTSNNEFSEQGISLCYVKDKNIGIANESTGGAGNVAGLVPMIYTSYNDFRTFGVNQMFENTFHGYYTEQGGISLLEYGGKSYMRYSKIQLMRTSFNLTKALANDPSQYQYAGLLLSYIKSLGVWDKVSASPTMDENLVESALHTDKISIETNFTTWLKNPHGFTEFAIGLNKQDVSDITKQMESEYYAKIVHN